MRTRMRIPKDALTTAAPAKRPAANQKSAALTTAEAASQPGTLGDHADASTILGWQSRVGNQAVQRMLQDQGAASTIQRDDDDVAAGADTVADVDDAPDQAAAPLLSNSQSATAISFYRAQDGYTPEIIGQIQAALGTPVTGVMADTDVQAAAAWQNGLDMSETPVLKVDGMIGPRTLPTLFRQGLAAQDQIESYTGEARDILNKWADLGTAQARITALVDKVNEYLTNAKVPICKPVIDDAGGNLGEFDFATWSLEIGKTAFEKDEPTPAEKADMADTIYHESRHAEQWYRMAQLQAQDNKDPAKLATAMSIPNDIAAQAIADPLEKGSMDALVAKGWNDSVYGAGSDHRDKVLKELSAAGAALEKANEAYKKNKTPANLKAMQAADARDDKARAAYFDLPEENDANRIGGRVTTAYNAAEATATNDTED